MNIKYTKKDKPSDNYSDISGIEVDIHQSGAYRVTLVLDRYVNSRALRNLLVHKEGYKENCRLYFYSKDGAIVSFKNGREVK